MALFKCSFYSEMLVRETNVLVIIPHDERPDGKREYETVYLLHGWGDGYNIWARFTSIERYANDYGFAVVMPDGGNSFYVDSEHGARYFSYITEELPRKMRRWLPVTDDPAETYLAGLSMGGYGTLRIGLTYPERYAGIGVFSAGLKTDLIPDFCESPLGNVMLHETVNDAFEGKVSEDEFVPEKLIERCLAQGRKLPAITHYVGRQDFLYDMNTELRDHINDINEQAGRPLIRYTFEDWDGDHEWGFWDTAIRKCLKGWREG